MSISDSNADDDLVLKWYEENPIEVTEGIELPQFDLTGVKTGYCAPKMYRTGKNRTYF